MYVEGAAQGSDFERRAGAKGFRLFAERDGIKGIEFRMFGGRNQTYKAFRTALQTREDDEVVLLLIDSEEPVGHGMKGWEHIGSRQGDELRQPDGASEEHLFLMVCTMETWLVSDSKCLASFFGHGFNEASLKEWPDLEAVPKSTIIAALQRATSACSKQYEKGRTSFEILEKTDPSVVKKKCPAAARLLGRLGSHVGSSTP